MPHGKRERCLTRVVRIADRARRRSMLRVLRVRLPLRQAPLYQRPRRLLRQLHRWRQRLHRLPSRYLRLALIPGVTQPRARRCRVHRIWRKALSPPIRP